jgi:flagellar biosynthetic protein FliO
MLYLETFSALGLILGLIGLLYWAGTRIDRRFGAGSPHRKMQLSERVSLGDKRSLLLVRIEGKAYVLGATNQNISLIATLDAVEQPESLGDELEEDPRPGKSVFQSILEAVR